MKVFTLLLQINFILKTYFYFSSKIQFKHYHYILTHFNTVAFLFSDEEVIPHPRQTPEDVEVDHIMEGEEAGLPIYAALGARPKRPLPPLPVPPPKPARLRVVAEVHPSSRSSDSSTYFEVEEEAEEVV